MNIGIFVFNELPVELLGKHVTARNGLGEPIGEGTIVKVYTSTFVMQTDRGFVKVLWGHAMELDDWLRGMEAKNPPDVTTMTQLERMSRIENGEECCPVCDGTKKIPIPGLVAHLYSDKSDMPCIMCCPRTSADDLLRVVREGLDQKDL